MAKDIHDKYVDQPFTTDFAIMFLPFENIYEEVIRRTALVEMLQKDWKIVVTGPTTLGAILNSLQMGFRTPVSYTHLNKPAFPFLSVSVQSFHIIFQLLQVI